MDSGLWNMVLVIFGLLFIGVNGLHKCTVITILAQKRALCSAQQLQEVPKILPNDIKVIIVDTVCFS